MTHYELIQLVKRPITPAVQAYLDRAKMRLSQGVSYNPEWNPEWNKSERFRFVENPESGLRLVGKVQDIEDSHIDHRGWYTDPHNDVFKDGTGLCYGVVYRLPARNGECSYVPGAQDGTDAHYNNGGANLDFHAVTPDLKQAIRDADHMAENIAEAEREYQTQSMAESRMEDIADELKKSRSGLRALIRELKQTTGINPKGAICQAIRAQIASMRETAWELAKERDKLKDDPFSIIHGY